jgi:V/A-type H+-transporting ATPase subunit F
MYKIGVIGDKDSVLGFKAVGMSVFPVTSPLEAQEVLDKLADEQFAVVYITEQLAKNIMSAIDKYNDERFPAIIPIPSNQGTLGIGMQGVKKSVERAVGADILFRDE